jgi:hypothetical protein
MKRKLVAASLAVAVALSAIGSASAHGSRFHNWRHDAWRTSKAQQVCGWVWRYNRYQWVCWWR